MQATRRFVAALLAASAGLALCGCVKNTATGRSQLQVMSRSTQVQMGLDEGTKMTQAYGGEVPDAQCRAYVTAVGTKLLLGVEKEYKDLPWKFTLLNSDVINAFSLPGGQVFISRALLQDMTNEAQLAGVLGHEIGHVTAQHINDRMVRQTGLSVGAAVLGAAGGDKYGEAISAVVSQGGGLFLLKYDRGEETEADHLGVRYMVRAHYNPHAQVEVMEILKAVAGSGGAEWTQTHPLPQTRISDLQAYIAKNYAKQADDPSYVYNQAEIQPIVARLKSLPPAPKPQGG